VITDGSFLVGVGTSTGKVVSLSMHAHSYCTRVQLYSTVLEHSHIITTVAELWLTERASLW